MDSNIEWAQFAAMPEMFYTAWCSLTEALKLKKKDKLLIRGGTSSVGLAACQIARAMGATVAATTRKADRADLSPASTVRMSFSQTTAPLKNS